MVKKVDFPISGFPNKAQTAKLNLFENYMKLKEIYPPEGSRQETLSARLTGKVNTNNNHGMYGLA